MARLKWKEINFETDVIRHTPPKTARHNIELLLPLTQHLRDALEKANAARQTNFSYFTKLRQISQISPDSLFCALPLAARLPLGDN